MQGVAMQGPLPCMRGDKKKKQQMLRKQKVGGRTP